MARATEERVRDTANALGRGRARATAVLIAATLLVSGCWPIFVWLSPDEKPPDPPFAVNNELDAAIERWSKNDYGISHDNVLKDSVAFLRERFPQGSKTQDVLVYFSEIGGTCAPGSGANTYVCEYCKVKIKGDLDPVYKHASYGGYEYLWRLEVSSTPGSARVSDDQRIEQLSLRLGRGGSGYIPDGDFSGVALDCPSARRRVDDPAFGPDPTAIQPLYLRYDVYEQTHH
jgi:hypothetical protein